MHRSVEPILRTPLIPAVLPADSKRAQLILAIAAITVFSGLSISLAICSKAFLEGDACTHYIYARAAFSEPYYLVNVWGRPFATALYALPAHFGGRLAVRFTSLLAALVVALVSWRIAQNQGWRWPVLALLFTLAQPLVFLHSFSELTELPFALLMALGFWAYQARQFLWMALIVGFTPTSRPEGFAFVALAAVALVLHRRSWLVAILLLPVLLWDYTGWRMYGEPGPWWHWLSANWPYDKRSLYTPGPLLHFVYFLPAITSPFIFPATLVGLMSCLFSRRSFETNSLQSPSGDSSAIKLLIANWFHRFFTDHRQRCCVLIAVLPMCILIGHGLLYWRGAMSSNGEVRYMLIAAPFWALLGARGFAAIFTTFNWRYPLTIAAVAAVLPAYVNHAYPVLPVVTMPDWTEAQTIADWYRTMPVSPQYPHVVITHPGLLYDLDMSPTDPRIVEWRRDIIDKVPPGTILIWDRIGGLFNSDAARSIDLPELEKAGWTPMDDSEIPIEDGGFGKWHFYKSKPLLPGAASQDPNRKL